MHNKNRDFCLVVIDFDPPLVDERETETLVQRDSHRTALEPQIGALFLVIGMREHQLEVPVVGIRPAPVGVFDLVHNFLVSCQPGPVAISALVLSRDGPVLDIRGQL